MLVTTVEVVGINATKLLQQSAFENPHRINTQVYYYCFEDFNVNDLKRKCLAYCFSDQHVRAINLISVPEISFPETQYWHKLTDEVFIKYYVCPSSFSVPYNGSFSDKRRSILLYSTCNRFNYSNNVQILEYS